MNIWTKFEHFIISNKITSIKELLLFLFNKKKLVNNRKKVDNNKSFFHTACEIFSNIIDPYSIFSNRCSYNEKLNNSAVKKDNALRNCIHPGAVNFFNINSKKYNEYIKSYNEILEDKTPDLIFGENTQDNSRIKQNTVLIFNSGVKKYLYLEEQHEFISIAFLVGKISAVYKGKKDNTSKIDTKIVRFFRQGYLPRENIYEYIEIK